LLDVREILRSPSLLLHGYESLERNEPNQQCIVERLYECPRVFLFERKWLGHKDVDGRFRMGIAPELQDLHALVPDPTLADRDGCKLLHRHGNAGAIAQRGKRREGALDVLRNELDDEINVLREPEVAVGANRQPPATR
jgi:hypothetical protein